MDNFKQYRRKQIAELRPYAEGEILSDRVSVSAADREAGSPKPGDMIARNPKNHDDQWLVAAKYFADNFEPIRQPEAHFDDVAVDQFAAEMKAKLAKKRAEGRGGWSDKSQCSQQFLSDLLRGHVDKGDPVDIGNFAMMLWNRNERVVQKPEAQAVAWRVTLVYPQWSEDGTERIPGQFREEVKVTDSLEHAKSLHSINEKRGRIEPLYTAHGAVADVATMVDRFLGWPLPPSVCSDLCVTNPHGAHAHLRSGTNLLTADEARQMFKYVLAATPRADGVKGE